MDQKSDDNRIKAETINADRMATKAQARAILGDLDLVSRDKNDEGAANIRPPVKTYKVKGQRSKMNQTGAVIFLTSLGIRTSIRLEDTKITDKILLRWWHGLESELSG